MEEDTLQEKDIDIKELLSENGPCKVYRAIHSSLREVAVKQLKQENERQHALYDIQMCREARCLIQLCHPNIVQCFGLIWEPNFHAIVLEYVAEDLIDTIQLHPHDFVKAKLLCDVARGRYMCV